MLTAGGSDLSGLAGPLPDQPVLLQPLSEGAVLRQDVTQQQVVLLLLCGHKKHQSLSSFVLPAQQRLGGRTRGPGGVGPDDAAEFCDRLLPEAPPPVRRVPEGAEQGFEAASAFSGRIRASYSGRSAISLTSAMTSLCSRSRCLRRTSFCCRGTHSGQKRHTSVSEPQACRLGVLVLPACGSGKHNGSRMLSRPGEIKKFRN